MTTSQPLHPPAAAPSGCPAHEGVVSLSGPRFQTGPAALYEELRQRYGAVAPVLLDGDIPAWLVIGYRELYRVASEPTVYSRDSSLWSAWDRIPEDWPLLPMIGHDQQSVLYTVGAAHERRAGLISDALAAIDPYELRDHAERYADGLIDMFCGTGEADLIAQYAKTLPVLVLARIYGVPDEEALRMVWAMNAMIDSTEEAIEGQQYLYTGIQRLVAEKRAHPGPDVASRMISQGTSFTDEEIVQDLMALMVAGPPPTSDWIGNSLRLMLTDDRFAVSLSGGRRSIGQAMNEVLWEDTPAQNVAGRWATRDTILGGQRIRTGDLLLLGLAGANADPRVRPQAPARTEDNNAFLSFGYGDHRCPFLAQEIAETVARTGIEVLIDRLPDVDLAVSDQALVWRPSPWLRGLAALPVRFTPAPTLHGR